MNATPPLPESSPAPAPRAATRDGQALSWTPALPFSTGLRSLALTVGSLLLVATISLFDYWAGRGLSFALLYLVPVAVAAWWCGFAPGVLVSLGGTVAWYLLDVYEGHSDGVAVDLWNGLTRFGTFVFTSSLMARLRVAMQRERALARTDPLTGAANARTFYEAACMELQRAQRTGRPLTLAYLDLDDFKRLNDRMGHVEGDRALRRLADTALHDIRAGDTLARLGGDEFALLLPETAGDEAARLLRRLHGLLAAEAARAGWPVSVSVGAATFARPPREVDVMVRRADALMYAAKRGGKGRVEHQVFLDEVKDTPAVERRASARILCERPARVQGLAGAGPRDEFGSVLDLSGSGARISLGCRVPPDALMAVEPLFPCGATALLCRVVWAAPHGAGWLHGCALAVPLTAREMRLWLTGPKPESVADRVAALVAPGGPPPGPQTPAC